MKEIFHELSIYQLRLNVAIFFFLNTFNSIFFNIEKKIEFIYIDVKILEHY